MVSCIETNTDYSPDFHNVGHRAVWLRKVADISVCQSTYTTTACFGLSVCSHRQAVFQNSVNGMLCNKHMPN